MTNEQLTVLLRALLNDLHNAIDKCDAELGTDSPRHIEKRWIGSNAPLVFFRNDDPANWEEYPGTVIALDYLHVFADSLDSMIVDLKGPTS